MPFDGYGIGGALEKENLGTIVRWCNEELPENKPRHLLGISEPDDIFTAIENGADTFDCVSPHTCCPKLGVLHPRTAGSTCPGGPSTKPISGHCRTAATATPA